MVEKLARLTADQRNNFVAYLDGELDDVQSQQIEQLLAQNEVARHEMESLAATWELLDVLPRPQAPENFSQKTMATLQLENQHVSLQDQAWFLQTRRLTLLFACWTGVVICGLAGFVLARSVPPNNVDVLIKNYALLNRLDSYQEIQSSTFLDRLQRSPEWSQRNKGPQTGAAK